MSSTAKKTVTVVSGADANKHKNVTDTSSGVRKPTVLGPQKDKMQKGHIVK